MIKELKDGTGEYKIRRSDINLSSFGSYFKKMVLGDKPAPEEDRNVNSQPALSMGNDSIMEAADSLMHHPLKQESSRTLTALAGHESKRSKSNMYQRRTSNDHKHPVLMDPSHQNLLDQYAFSPYHGVRSNTTFDPMATMNHQIAGLPPIFNTRPQIEEAAALMQNQ